MGRWNLWIILVWNPRHWGRMDLHCKEESWRVKEAPWVEKDAHFRRTSTVQKTLWHFRMACCSERIWTWWKIEACKRPSWNLDTSITERIESHFGGLSCEFQQTWKAYRSWKLPLIFEGEGPCIFCSMSLDSWKDWRNGVVHNLLEPEWPNWFCMLAQDFRLGKNEARVPWLLQDLKSCYWQLYDVCLWLFRADNRWDASSR